MVAIVPSGQTTQLVGMPPLPKESLDKLRENVGDVYRLYQEMAEELEREGGAV